MTVALSGGLDSVVLLDLLLALRLRRRWRISAAHFDHRMREGSAAEAEWVRALCDRREVPCRLGRAEAVPRNEAKARSMRYEFLHQARLELGSDRLATGHQADDQAETVLFRLLRGSGLAGLAGIPAARSPSVVRPLLPFWRAEIEEYATARRLAFLVDPSNRDLRIARNRLRHKVIPEMEAGGAVDFRRQLCRLAGLAARAKRVVERRAEEAADELVLEASESRIVVARTDFLTYDDGARAHLLRVLAGRVGPGTGRVGTRVGLEFISSGSSGRTVELAGGLRISREFERLIFERRSAQSARDEQLLIPDVGGGEADVSIGGVLWRVRWALGDPREHSRGGEECTCLDSSQLRFPLAVRGWQPGDRIRLAGGTRKLKKVFVEGRVGRSERRCHPLLTHRSGVLWVVGVVRGVEAIPCGDDTALFVCVQRR